MLFLLSPQSGSHGGPPQGKPARQLSFYVGHSVSGVAEHNLSSRIHVGVLAQWLLGMHTLDIMLYLVLPSGYFQAFVTQHMQTNVCVLLVSVFASWSSWTLNGALCFAS